MWGAMAATGYNLKRAVVAPDLCAELRHEAMAVVAEREKQSATWRAWAWRLLGDSIGHRGGLAGTEMGNVREPEKRAHVQIGMSSAAHAVLCAALGPSGALRKATAEAGLSGAARLVELSVMVVMPGAIAQSVHSDVPPHVNHPMSTMWLALQDVPAELGPTMVHETSTEQLAQRERWSRDLHAMPRKSLMITYGPDGSSDEDHLEVSNPGDVAYHLSVPQLLAGDGALPMVMVTCVQPSVAFTSPASRHLLLKVFAAGHAVSRRRHAFGYAYLPLRFSQRQQHDPRTAPCHVCMPQANRSLHATPHHHSTTLRNDMLC